jgi:predicted AAA+ superfamily ATPase
MLAALLPERVGAPLSVAGLQTILETSHPTMTRWISSLKELYLIYEIKPWSNNITRSLKKEGKFYMWDYGEVPDPGARFENMIGSHLLKACHCWTDMGEGKFELFYLRNKEKQEIDFLIVRDGKPWLPVEAKTGSTTPALNWKKMMPQLPCKLAIQVCLTPGIWSIHAQGDRKLIIASADEFLRYLP